jgi:restriction system protein
MVFSTAGFQSGALEYAGQHGIATVQFADGSSSWGTRSLGGPKGRPPRAQEYAAWIIFGTTGKSHTIMRGQPDALLRAFEPTEGV